MTAQFDDSVPLSDYSAALDEIWRLRRALAYEAAGMEVSLELKTFPASRRTVSEEQIRRMRLSAQGLSQAAYAGHISRNLDLALEGLTGTATLTRAAFEAERPATRGDVVREADDFNLADPELPSSDAPVSAPIASVTEPLAQAASIVPRMVTVACDGSALSNPVGPGGWGWYVNDDCWAAGGVPQATNNAMELTALLRFLQATEGMLNDVPTVIRCDSKYVLDGVQKWSPGWIKNGWKNSAGQPVKNKELFQAILPLVAGRSATTFEWVKGHSGDPMNEAVDACCTGASQAILNGLPVPTGPGWVGRHEAT